MREEAFAGRVVGIGLRSRRGAASRQAQNWQGFRRRTFTGSAKIHRSRFEFDHQDARSGPPGENPAGTFGIPYRRPVQLLRVRWSALHVIGNRRHVGVNFHGPLSADPGLPVRLSTRRLDTLSPPPTTSGRPATTARSGQLPESSCR